ncbi:MAG: ABC transporter ATP-binding protein [Schleiferilactobacillus perolens]|uniref:ABC transporter ATP-binding protein n=1 Tax=Schleiferilactobacillus perolens TaxID=100468 RepID=UPI0039EBF2C2
MTNDSLLAVSHLTKHYPQFTLQDVSFTIAPGTIMGMIGVNGAGKSTTLKSIAGLVNPTSGTIQLAGAENLAVMLGETVYYPEKKLAAITKTTRQFYSQWDEDQYRYYLRFFNLDDQKKVKELSTGMQIKYQLAVTMSHHASMLILDEPTSGIDPVSRDAIRQVFRHYVADGRHSILFSTHITTDLAAIADTITYIHAGAVLYSATKADFIDHFRREFGLGVDAPLNFDDIMIKIERKDSDDSAIPA